LHYPTDTPHDRQTRIFIALGCAQTLAWARPTSVRDHGGTHGARAWHRPSSAGAPFLFALPLERYGASALLLSSALGLVVLATLLSLIASSMAEHI
jgi:hypothetical protein